MRRYYHTYFQKAREKCDFLKNQCVRQTNEEKSSCFGRLNKRKLSAKQLPQMVGRLP